MQSVLCNRTHTHTYTLYMYIHTCIYTSSIGRFCYSGRGLRSLRSLLSHGHGDVHVGVVFLVSLASATPGVAPLASLLSHRHGGVDIV